MSGINCIIIFPECDIMFISVLQTALQSLIFFALHFKSNGSFPRQLSAKEERECLEKAAQGDLAARDKLINHNLRLVAYIVKKALPRQQGSGRSYLDRHNRAHPCRRNL